MKNRYSISRIIHAEMKKNPKTAPLEYGLSSEISETNGEMPRGFFIPGGISTRDLTVGTPGDGGDLVGEAKGPLIPSLKSQPQVVALGAQPLDGLVGDVSLPSLTTGVTFTETTEGTPAPEQNPVFGLVNLTPGQHSVNIDLSRKMMLQSSVSVDGFIKEEILGAVAAKVDDIAIQEILNNTNVPVVAMGTNGALPTWAKICELEETAFTANGIVNAPGWLTNHKAASILKQTEKSVGSEFIYSGNRLAGHKVGLTTQVPGNLTKGTSAGICSAMIFGSFDQMVIAQWGALDVTVDKFSMSTSGTVRLVVFFDVAVGLKQPGSFGVIKDLLTN